ncbi:MAG: ABC transporter ATP-binding protein [Lysobacterales bacterium]|nr:ABC transporter ATP-binding protein [Xanthomonadales bacterium]
MPLIEARELVRRFDERVAVDRVSFTLEAGRVLALLGPNGAGKTTTMRVLAGLLAPSEGSAVVCGHALGQRDQDNDAIRARCGVVPEAPGFYERLSAIDNLRFFGGLHGLERRDIEARVSAGLERFNLQDRGKDRVGTYSKGMKQRLSLARALLHQPQLLFLDEPTAGLDPRATAELHALIRDLRTQGCGIVLSTHSLEEAESLADEILVIDTRTLFYGHPQDLQPRKQLEIQIRMLGELPDDLVWPSGCKLLGADTGLARFELTDPKRETPALIAALVKAEVPILAVEPVRRGLRERYLELLNR